MHLHIHNGHVSIARYLSGVWVAFWAHSDNACILICPCNLGINSKTTTYKARNHTNINRSLHAQWHSVLSWSSKGIFSWTHSPDQVDDHVQLCSHMNQIYTVTAVTYIHATCEWIVILVIWKWTQTHESWLTDSLRNWDFYSVNPHIVLQ